MVAAAEFERVRTIRAQQLPSFTEHLLAMPQDDEGFERIKIDLRDPDL